jgi:hypothetical protein
LDLQDVIWKSVGFAFLGSLSNVRRAQLKALTAGPGRGLVALHEFLASISTEADEPGSIGLLANLVAARMAEQSGDIQAPLVAKAVNLAMEGRPAAETATELCLIAIGYGHAFGNPLDPFLAYLVGEEEPGKGPNRLEARLANTPDPAVADMALWLCQASRRSDLPDLASSIFDVLRDKAKNASNQEAAGVIRRRLDIAELELDLDAGERPDADTVLKEWEDRRETQEYPRVIWLLMQSAEATASPRLLDEATWTLERAPQPIQFSSYIHLATKVALEASPMYGGVAGPAGARAFKTAIHLLSREFPHWRGQLTIESIIGILQLLAREDRERADQYRSELLAWEVAQHERDLVGKLPTLVQQGRFFLLFWHYFQALRVLDPPSGRASGPAAHDRALA